METSKTVLRSVGDKQIIELIASATKQIVFIAPGLSEDIAKAIAERWKILGPLAVKVILDVDAEVSRLGYGTIEALELLQHTATEVQALITHQAGIRIGILVVDDKTTIFSPTPLLIEAGMRQSVHPNAICLPFVPSDLIQDLGQGENGIKSQTIGLDALSPKKITEVKSDLQKNPPMKFDIARKVRVFNAQFEFVEFSLKGGRISQKRVSIPSDLMGLARDEKTKRLLQSSFYLVDSSSKFAGDEINQLKEEISKHYLIALPGYGNVVLRLIKDKFEFEVETLKQKIMDFKNRAMINLDSEIEANRQALVEALLPAVRQNMPEDWHKYFGNKPSEGDIRRMLDGELKRIFGSAKDVLEDIEVKILFKGITYELLNDPKFIHIARQKIPQMVKLFEEYDAARTT